VGHLVLAGRRAPDAGMLEKIAALRAETGATIVTAQVDVSERAQVDALIARFARDDRSEGADWPALKGVVHAAGVLDDVVVASLSAERLSRVFGPKALGAAHLDALTRDRELDLFVLYSSVAATLGSAGQANYAAANGYLDGLAAARRAAGLAATSIAWGPWADGGMATSEAAGANLRRHGLVPLTAERAHQALARVLANGRASAAIVDADWRRLGEVLGAARSPLLADLLASAGERAAGSSALAERLKGAPSGEREGLLSALVQGELQQVLGLASAPDPKAGFFDLGMDSLMAVELRNRLNRALGGAVTLGNTAAFDFPTIDKLVDHIGESLGALPAHGRPQLAASVPGAAASAIAANVPQTPPSGLIDRTRPVPATPQQQALWFLDRMNPIAGIAYNVWTAVRVEGEFDRAAAEMAARQIVGRHEALRTRFVEDVEDGPKQRIGALTAKVFRFVDLLGENRQQSLDGIISAITQQRIDLAEGPLFAVHLIRLAETDHVLLFLGHHTVWDGISAGIVMREFWEVYAAFVGGSLPALPVLPAQYADYAVWLAREATSEHYAASLEYWRRSLWEAPEVITLPMAPSRSAVRDYATASLPFRVSSDTLLAIRSAAKAQGVTLFAVLQAALAVLLHRTGGDTDIVIGIPTAGRLDAAVENAVGYFVKVLPLRHRIEPLASFGTLVGEAAATIQSGLRHGIVSYSDIVNAVVPTRSGGFAPLVQVSLTLEAPDAIGPGSEFSLPGRASASISRSTSSSDPKG
jgi:acyl carrier protein